MKSSQNIQRLGHTKFTSCSLDFVLKTLERANDLKMLISFPFFVCFVPVVFRMKIKISKSCLSLLISGIICLNLLKNKIFKIKIWSLASENT
jgi:hypothetical protein